MVSLRSLTLLIVFSLLLAACGGGGENNVDGGSAGDASGSAQRGEELFEQTAIGPNSAPGCIACHSLQPGQNLVGPSLANIGARAGDVVAGMSAEEYLHESIVAPDAHVVEGYAPGLMYQNYAQDLTEGQINDLVAYMLTLE